VGADQDRHDRGAKLGQRAVTPTRQIPTAWARGCGSKRPWIN